jgi:hypothetical protein
LDINRLKLFKNHEGKGVQIVGEARPARWHLKEGAN